ncbi:MAG: transporter substrate-binding domain-containing protein [Eubacteriaceae bacterium]|nr:transporter substrate-binding domain-containing protein [Eubacteriaceae bacterium]
MRSKRIRSFLTVILMTLCVISVFAFTDTAEAKTSRTIKVAVLNNSTYAYRDKNGVWRGSDVECMINIAQKAGLKIKFIDSSADPDFLGNLDKGKYDIVADVVKTSDRKDKYLFTDEMIGTVNSTLAVRADDDRWSYGDIDQISKMEIGVVGSYANNNDFRKWCRRHDVYPTIKEYKDIKEMSAALKKGRIDGEVYSAESGEQYTSKFHTIMKILPETYYFAFRRDDVALKNKVDAAIAQILSGDVDYFTNLKHKYEVQFKSNVLPLSNTEKKYIAKHKTLLVGVVEDDEPYYSGKGSNNIIQDYYKLIAKYAGFKVRYKVYDTREKMISAENSGKIDVIALYSDGIITAYQSGLALTDSYSSVSNILLTKQGSDSSQVRRIAVKKSTMDSLHENVNDVFPKAELVGYESARDCFDAMESEETDAMLIGLPSATWLINQTNSTAYSVIPVPGITTYLCSAVRTDDQVLCSILNKSIIATKANFTGISTRDTLPGNDLKAAISRIPSMIIIAVLFVMLALIIGLVWALMMLRRRQKEHADMLAAQAEAKLQKMQAEESRKSAMVKNEFFSNISHDMRTPLNAIIGFSNLALKEDMSPELRQYMSNIQSSGKLLNDLIDDTLTISRAGSGKFEFNLEPVRPVDLFETFLIPIRQETERKNITLTVDTSGVRKRTVLMDKLCIQKVFLNLLTNAVKYTPEGGHIWLKMSFDPEDADDPDSLIMVRDDGIGIDADYLPHIFEPFSQENRPGYKAGGTGLGLSIVKQIVDQMGGIIEVASEKGRGSVFTVRLHFAEVRDTDGQADQIKPSGEVNIRGKKILLCEDNILNREIAAALLEEEGADIVEAADGAEGLKIFSASAESEYDAILMDLRMPVMNGYEATEAIRALARKDAGSVPIIAMTADAFEDDKNKCLAAGMNAHIAKPLDPDTMMRTIAETISAAAD